MTSTLSNVLNPHAGPHTAAAEEELEVQFGVEFEFVLAAIHLIMGGPKDVIPTNHEQDAQHYSGHTLEGFADTFAHKYNHHHWKFFQQYQAYFKQLQSLVKDEEENYELEDKKEQYKYWILEYLREPVPEGKVPLELISPILDPHDFLYVVRPVWHFINHHYRVTKENLPVSTHVHVATKAPKYTLIQLQLIAAFIIHWEPAWEAVINDDMRGQRLSKSNYMENPNFAPARKTRAQVIAEIKACKSIPQLIKLMQPRAEKLFGFNFLNCLEDGCQTMEFRRGSMSVDTHDAEMWISVAAAFFIAAMKMKVIDEILKIAATVKNLEQVMLGASKLLPKASIERLFEGKREKPTERPRLSNQPWSENWTQQQQKNMWDMTAADIGITA